MNLLNKNEKLVIYMLGSFMGDKMLCWPSHEELARVCGMSIKTVQRTLKSLETVHHIIFVERQHRQSNRYQFNPSWLCIFDELNVKIGSAGRQNGIFRASNCRTNIIKNIYITKGHTNGSLKSVDKSLEGYRKECEGKTFTNEIALNAIRDIRNKLN